MQHRELRIYVSLLLIGMLAVLAFRFGVPLPGKPAGLGRYVMTDLGVITGRKPVGAKKAQTQADWLLGRYVLYPLKSIVPKTVPPPGDGLKAHNRRGETLGCFNLAGNRGEHALLLDQGKSRDLGTLGGKMSYASALNDAGEVAGYSARADHSLHAFLWQEGKMLDLGTLGGRNSWAWDLDPWGHVVGEADTSGGTAHAFLYDNGILTDLGTLGGETSAARGINERGQVVGEAETAHGETHAFVYSSGMMGDLNRQANVPKDWTLTSATRIDAAGRIWGEALYKYTLHSFLLTPAS